MGSKTFGTGNNLGYELRRGNKLASLGINIDCADLAYITPRNSCEDNWDSPVDRISNNESRFARVHHVTDFIQYEVIHLLTRGVGRHIDVRRNLDVDLKASCLWK